VITPLPQNIDPHPAVVHFIPFLPFHMKHRRSLSPAMIARYSSRRVLFGVAACLFVGATLLHGPQLYTFGSSALSTGRPPAAAPSSVQFVEEEKKKKEEEPTDLIEDIRNTTLGVSSGPFRQDFNQSIIRPLALTS
jgi:hypothetical protein